jgi:hypothetical protein
MAEALLENAGYRSAGGGSVRGLHLPKTRGTGLFRLISMMFSTPMPRIPILNMHEFDEADDAIRSIGDRVDKFIDKMNSRDPEPSKPISEIVKTDDPLN